MIVRNELDIHRGTGSLFAELDGMTARVMLIISRTEAMEPRVRGAPRGCGLSLPLPALDSAPSVRRRAAVVKTSNPLRDAEAKEERPGTRSLRNA